MEVTLNGGAPWGFRLQGGAGTGAPLTVYKVRRKSKAYRRLREGDRIVSVNGRSCERLTYEQLMDIADASKDTLTLLLQRRECDKEEKPLPEVQELASSKSIDEKESVRLLDDVTPPKVSVDPFPSFVDLQTDSSQVLSDDHFTKTTTETTHQVSGDTTRSFSRTERDCVSKSPGLPDITLDTIDLNNLISETQKRLDSFRNTWTPSPTLAHSVEQVQAPSHSVDTSHQTSESTSLEKTEPKEKSPPVKQVTPKSNVLDDAFQQCLLEMDSAFHLPDIGFSSHSSETITTDIPGGTATLVKKKKQFSSSSFYEEPQSIYPTLEEQVEMARKIADSLADDTNSKSKGANMFYKRLKRSTHWIHEGPEPSDESGPCTPEVEPPDAPFRLSKGPPRLKLLLDPRQPLDLNALRCSGSVISEHNVVSPEVCHGLVKDLQSPLGKGAALFAKRKKKSEEWVVDEERVKTMLREQQERKAHTQLQDVRLFKSPWEAAMERVRPDQLADTLIRRADSIRSESLSRESSRMEGYVSPTLAPLQDIYHAKHPRGWEGSSDTVTYAPQPASSVHNGYQGGRKLVFQNFNAVPRVWKGASVH